MEEQEKAPYGYCTNCAEPFDKPYTHCPFCNAVNSHFEKDIEKSKQNFQDRLSKQMEANREWTAQNQAEVTAEVDARIEQNLAEMKQQLRNPKNLLKSEKAKTPVPSITPAPRPEDNLGRAFGMKPQNPNQKGNSSCLLWVLLVLVGIVLLVAGLWLILK